MPANHRIDIEARLLITTWEGVARDVELIDAIKQYQENIQSHPDYAHYNELVDFTNVTSIKLTTEGIKKIGQIASTTDRSEIRRKLAFVVSSNLAFGLARMYGVYRSFWGESHKDIRVFKAEQEALDWLQE